MLKNDLFSSYAKAFICFCIAFFAFFSLLTQSTSCSRKQLTLHCIDTLSISHDIGMVRSYYSPVENAILNTYYYTTDDGYAVLNYCKESIYPIKQFMHKNYIQNCIVENDSCLIIQFSADSFLLRVDNNGFVKDTITLNMRYENEEKYIMTTIMEHYYVPSKGDSGMLFCNCFLPSETDFLLNYSSRKSMFSKPVFDQLIVEKSRVEHTERGIGRFPNAHSQKDTVRYYYKGMSTMNKDTDIVKIYAFVDSVFIIHRDGAQERHFFRSKYQKHENEMLTVSVYDYVGLENFICSQTTYEGILYDPYRNYYYVVVTRPMNPENDDGTRKNLIERPWSLIVLDSDFRKLTEIDMPEHFVPYDCMVTSEGLAVMDYSLTEKNKNVYVICDIY